MTIAESLLPEYDQEMANVRKSLERIPEGKLDWKPHEKSWPFVGLATHIANMPGWTVMTIEQESFDMAPGGEQIREEPVTSVQHALEMFDRNTAAARAAVAGATDEQLLAPWSLLAGGQPIFTMPRVAVVRLMIMNHMIHHRAQLGMYLRLNDIPVPSIYGPSADEEA
jgi:uncharacterized damage-inducible protein DinB